MTKHKLHALFILAVSVLLSSTGFARPENPSDNLTTYENCKNQKRAIVTGVSVSLGFFGPSPSMMYLERAGFSRQCILKKTLPITDSRKKLEWMKESVRDFKPDVIVALDLLFHDISFLHNQNDMAARADEINTTVEYLKSTGVPVIIGTVFSLEPQKYPFRQSLVEQTNAKLCAIQNEPSSNFFVMPTARIYQYIYRGTFKIKRGDETLTLSKREVLVDMYHVGPRGAYMLTNRLISALNEFHDESGFPFQAKPYKSAVIFRKPLTAPTQLINNYGGEINLLYKKVGSDTLLTVGPDTIPEVLGDEKCALHDAL